MKIAPFKIDQFIKDLPNNQNIFGALVYGPESGLVSINTKKIADIIVPNPSDPFLLTNIDAKKLTEDEGLLMDEFVSISMLGGRKLIKINDANNKTTNSLKVIFGNDKKSSQFNKPVGQNFILISASQLEASSVLRKFAESNPYFACLACYEDNEQVIRQNIGKKLKEYNLRAEEGVVDLIVNQFGKNRLIILNELEKLKLYMGDEELVTLEIAQELIADISQISLNEFINAFYSLDLKKSDYFLHKIFADKVNAIVIVRALSNYLLKLYQVKQNVAVGANLESEMKQQRIFFKQEVMFKKHLNIWPLKIMVTILEKLQELEVKCKSNNVANANLQLFSFNNFCFLRYRKLSS